MRSSSMLRTVIAGTLFAALAGSPAGAKTIRVPEDHASVTEAVERAVPGDRVEIGAGIWSPSRSGERFPLVLDGRDLEIAGAGGGATVLDAEERSRHFVFQGGDRSLVSGLSLERGSARRSEPGASILVDGASPGIFRVAIFPAGLGSESPAVCVRSGEPRFRHCLIRGDGSRGPGLLLESGDTHVEHCTIVAGSGGALSLRCDARLVLRWSIVACAEGGERIGDGSGPGIELPVRGTIRTPVLEENLFDVAPGSALRGSAESIRVFREESVASRGLEEGPPCFVAPERDDFRVRSESAARRRGATAGAIVEIGAFGGERSLGYREPRIRRSDGARAPEVSDRLLGPNVPNPSDPYTTIHFTVPEATVIDLAIYNILGQRVRTLLAGDVPAGEHTRGWDGRDDHQVDLPPGVYFVRVTQGHTTESRRIALVR